MHVLKLEYSLLFLWATSLQTGDTTQKNWPKLMKDWTDLRFLLKNKDTEKLEAALDQFAYSGKGLPTDAGSLKIIAEHIQERAPKRRAGSPCCLKRNNEVDETLKKLIAFHTQQVALLKNQPEERDNLASIERNIKKMPKKIRRSYEDLPNPD